MKTKQKAKPAKKTATAKKAATVKKTKPAKKAATVKKIKPAKKAAPAKKSKPAKKAVPAKKTVSKKTTVKKTAKKVSKTKAVKTTKKETKIQPFSENKRVSESTFLFTGTLNGMDRKTAEKMVTDLGGKIVSKVSDKLDYLIVGEKAGSKLKAAQKIPSIIILSSMAFDALINNEKELISGGSNDTPTSTDTNCKIKYYIYGYGGEHCISSLDETQLAFWKKKYKEEPYEASQELQDHVWNSDWGAEVPPTHFGKWYDNDNCLHEERAYYSQSSRLCVEVYKGDDQIEEFEIEVTDKSLKKHFHDEFVPNKKKEKGNAYLWCRSSDRGMYCYGETELEEGEVFDKSKLSISVGKVFNEQIVTDICYDDMELDNQGCYDSTGKGFDAEIIFY